MFTITTTPRRCRGEANAQMIRRYYASRSDLQLSAFPDRQHGVERRPTALDRIDRERQRVLGLNASTACGAPTATAGEGGCGRPPARVRQSDQ